MEQPGGLVPRGRGSQLQVGVKDIAAQRLPHRLQPGPSVSVDQVAVIGVDHGPAAGPPLVFGDGVGDPANGGVERGEVGVDGGAVEVVAVVVAGDGVITEQRVELFAEVAEGGVQPVGDGARW
jgi:hypothetical protein